MTFFNLRSGAALALALAFAAGASSPALADDVPDAWQRSGYQIVPVNYDGPVIQVDREGDGSEPFDFQSSSIPTVGVPYARAFASVAGTPVVSATAAISADYHLDVFSVLQYHILVSGSDPSLDVPIFYTAKLYTEAAGDPGTAPGIANAQLQVISAGIFSNVYTAQTCIAYCAPVPDTQLDIRDSILVRTGYYLSAIMSANAEAALGGQAYAYVDPYFYVDPAFLSEHPDYTLTFSRFVGNDPISSGVPEPATWALMVAGFALAGAAARGSWRRVAA